MDSGRIVERGTHDDLVAHGGIYHRLWTAWSAGRRATAVDSAPDPA